jgi:hypothetical protein
MCFCYVCLLILSLYYSMRMVCIYGMAYFFFISGISCMSFGWVGMYRFMIVVGFILNFNYL